MAVTLLQPYQGYAAGQVVDFSKELEDALVAQRLATAGGTPTAGALSTVATPVPNQLILRGIATIAVGASSVAITIPGVTAQSAVFASLQFTDATATFIRACVPTANTVTINVNANATAATKIAYLVVV